MTGRSHWPETVAVTRSNVFLPVVGSVGTDARTRASSDTPLSICVRDPNHERRVTMKLVCGSAMSWLTE